MIMGGKRSFQAPAIIFSQLVGQLHSEKWKLRRAEVASNSNYDSGLSGDALKPHIKIPCKRIMRLLAIALEHGKEAPSGISSTILHH